MTARPPSRRYCLGPSCDCPARSPRPAATMIAATLRLHRRTPASFPVRVNHSREAALQGNVLVFCACPDKLQGAMAKESTHCNRRSNFRRVRSQPSRMSGCLLHVRGHAAGEPCASRAALRHLRCSVPSARPPLRSRYCRVGDDRQRRVRQRRCAKPPSARWPTGRGCMPCSSRAAIRPGCGAPRRSWRTRRADLIDINFGCPAKKVVGGLSGSALMREPDLALRLVEATVAGAGERAGHGQDAARLGPLVDQCAGDRAPGRGRGRADDHRPWPHARRLLRRDRRLEGDRRRACAVSDPGRRQWRPRRPAQLPRCWRRAGRTR